MASIIHLDITGANALISMIHSQSTRLKELCMCVVAKATGDTNNSNDNREDK